MRKDAIAREKSDRLVQREFSLFDQVKRGQRERELKHGLHRRMCVWIEIAVHR